jgi:uncharacterized protein (TIGR04255 family)
MPSYTRNFLTNVIGRIDYQPILLLLRQEPAEFQEKIRHDFPRFSKEFLIELKLASEVHEDQQSKKPIAWKFKDKMATQEVTLTADFIAFETNKYTRFPDFSEKLSSIYRLFCETYRPELIKRIGLRYINQIYIPDGNPLEWDDLINSNLTSSLKAFPDWKQNILRSMHQLHLSKDDFKITFQFGIFNSEYPNTITKKEFILDYDCISEQETEPDRVIQYFEQFNKEIENLFEDSIGDGLRNLMGVL